MFMARRAKTIFRRTRRRKAARIDDFTGGYLGMFSLGITIYLDWFEGILCG